MVENRVSSALILEDDADWDIRIKSQLTDFAKLSRLFQGQDESSTTHSPYGDSWDLLWLGTCMDEPGPKGESNPELYPILNDMTVPSKRGLHMNREHDEQLLANFPEYTRLVHRPGSPICTYAYAVSYKGAQKLLYALSVKELRGNFDNALSWWCTDRQVVSPNCISVTPPYFYQHKSQTLVGGKNSDNGMWDPVEEKASTLSIRWSTRLNVERLLEGRTDFIDSYAEDALKD